MPVYFEVIRRQGEDNVLEQEVVFVEYRPLVRLQQAPPLLGSIGGFQFADSSGSAPELRTEKSRMSWRIARQCGCGVPDDDSDSDDIADCIDSCMAIPNPDQGDADGDGVGDSCDPCPNDAPDDTDSDGVCDSVDACAGYDDGTLCPIPAVSGWGLLALTLLVCTMATLLSMRRHA